MGREKEISLMNRFGNRLALPVFLLVLSFMASCATGSGGKSKSTGESGDSSNSGSSDSAGVAGSTDVVATESLGDGTSGASTPNDGVYGNIPLDANGQPLPLTLKGVVHLVLDNNNVVRLQQMEIIKSDTELMKEESKYSPKLYMSYSGYEKIDNPRYTSSFGGTHMTQDTYKAGISKLFSTGTFVQLEGSDTRFDNNAGEDPALYLAGMGQFAYFMNLPPIHTSAMTITMSQELLKNAFGYSQDRINQIARNNSAMKREDLTYQLSQLVVKAMIDYWNMSIEEENVQTQQLLYDNVLKIRNITRNKVGVGLAENFELNQWNALLAQSENGVKFATYNRDSKRRELLRTMNLKPDLKLTGATHLLETIPADINVERDIQSAYDSRPDYKNLQIMKRNAQIGAELAENQQLPSLSVGGKYSTRGQGYSVSGAAGRVPTGAYPESAIEVKLEYPLWDEGVKVDVRNSRIALKQIDIRERDLKRQIHDDIKDGYEQMKIAAESLKNARYAMEQTQLFYSRILIRYRQGRFTAEGLKSGLDALFQARLGYMRAKVNFNMALVRYDMIRNQIWSKFDVNIDDVIDRMAKQEHFN